MLDRLAGLASVVPLVVGSLTGPGGAPSGVDLTFRDPAIVESSGLVVRNGLVVTTNDSGDDGRVFVVGPSGRTVGTTSWSPGPEDVEALAPAGRGSVWVGDLGDNRRSRDSVRVLRVPYGPGDRVVRPASYTLVYPDGGHDAETLMAQPRTGRLFVVTKEVFGGTVYAAPPRLSPDHPNRLRAVADTIGMATDGAFLPDGRHYLLRDYGHATLFTFPGHERLGSFRLPEQRQGEGIAVAPDGSVHVSTEGQFTDVLSVRLPAWAGRATEPSPSAPQAPPAHTAPSASQRSSGSAPDDHGSFPWPWALGGLAVLVFGGAAARLLLRHGPTA